MTLDQLKTFIKIRNESALNSNLQFMVDAESCGIKATKDGPLGTPVNHGDGSFTWRTPFGMLSEDGGKLALWGKSYRETGGPQLICGTIGNPGSRDPLTSGEDREKLHSRGKVRRPVERPSIGETSMKTPNTRRGAAKTKPDPKSKPKSKPLADPSVDPAVAQDAVKKAAAIAKEKQAKIDATKKAQEQAQKKLPAFAKEIAHRLDAADVEDKKAGDHRVAAAIQLAAAEEQCKLAGVKFTEWFEANIPNRKYDTVQRLLKAGKAGDANAVAAAIADMRQKNASANKAHRAAKKNGTTPRGNSTHKGDLQLAEERLAALPDQARVELATKVAEKSGLAVVSKAAVETLKKATPVGTKVEQAVTLYQGMNGTEKFDFFTALEKITGYRMVDTSTNDVIAKK